MRVALAGRFATSARKNNIPALPPHERLHSCRKEIEHSTIHAHRFSLQHQSRCRPSRRSLAVGYISPWNQAKSRGRGWANLIAVAIGLNHGQ
jgi:hypothetical protein